MAQDFPGSLLATSTLGFKWAISSSADTSALESCGNGQGGKIAAPEEGMPLDVYLRS